jgi:putative transposase
MQLVEQTMIRKGDDRYDIIDHAAFASKNLYNATNYEIRQAFMCGHVWLRYEEIYHRMKTHEAYRALPTKVSQQVMKLLDKNWKSYFEACKAYEEDPSKFLGHPKLPKYKDKQKGRNILIYTIQALSRPALRRGVIQPSGLPLEIPTKQKDVTQVRIVPRTDCYVIEVVYEQEIKPQPVDPSLYASIDIGLNNLATLTSNKVGFVPRLVNGRPLKSVNQYYNKERARRQSLLPARRFTSRMLDRITAKRNRRVTHYLHAASRRIVNVLVAEGIGMLVIGKNINWKQEANMGKLNNQNFVQIPHAKFIDLLTYKCELIGITVILTEESYTSKCSFLDNEPIGKHETYLGKRTKRGLFRCASGKCFNADVNGSYNILRKVVPDAFVQGDSGCLVVHPSSLAV